MVCVQKCVCFLCVGHVRDKENERVNAFILVCFHTFLRGHALLWVCACAFACICVWKRKINPRTSTRRPFHSVSVFSQIIPCCNETRGCQSDAAYPELCPSRGGPLNEKVTSHPPVKEQMPHQSSTWQEEQVSLWGTRDAVGIGAGMAILHTYKHTDT